jgi:integrase
VSITEIKTDKSIEALRPPESGRREIKVKGAPGLCLRLSSTNKVWYLRARPPGVKNVAWLRLGNYGRGELGFTLSRARKKAKQWRDDIASGIDPRKEVQTAKRSTFKSVVDEFIKRGTTAKGEPWKPSTAKHYRNALNHQRLEHWHAIPVAQITERMVQDVINGLEDDGKHPTARRCLAYLRAFFAWCRKKKQGYIPRTQILPTDDIELEQPGDNARERYLSAAEIKVFWRATEALGYPYKQYYRLLLLTGQRCGNVTDIKRSDLQENTWHQIENKADRPFLLPLNELAIATLADCPNTGDYYLSVTGDTPIVQAVKAKRRLDAEIKSIIDDEKLQGVFVEPWINHDLRRTITTHMRKLRISRVVCSAILNHAETGVTARHYDQYELVDEKQSAMAAWSNYLFELIEGKSDNVVQLTEQAT